MCNVKIKIKGKEVTALEILTETEKDSLNLLKIATAQKERIKTLEKNLEEISIAIAEARAKISQKMEKVEAVEQYMDAAKLSPQPSD